MSEDQDYVVFKDDPSDLKENITLSPTFGIKINEEWFWIKRTKNADGMPILLVPKDAVKAWELSQSLLKAKQQ
jgi:hypothetical protein